MELSPQESYKVFDNIETALFDLGRYSEVEKFYRKVLENNPKRFKRWSKVGKCFKRKR